MRKTLHNLKKDSIEFSVIIRKESSWAGSSQSLPYNNVKVNEVRDDSVDFIIFSKSSINYIKDIPFDSIYEISAITKRSNILQHGPEFDRWSLMDIGEEEEE